MSGKTTSKILILLCLSLMASACGKKSQDPGPSVSFEADNLASQGSWIYGDWHLEGEPTSWGDLGADVRQLKIRPDEISYETFGHLAAESWRFNTDGFDFGGNCLFRVRSSLFGLKTEDTGTVSLYVANPRYELVDDPGNRDDCPRQIARINAVAESEHRVLGGFEPRDDETFRVTARFSLGNGKQTYHRLQVKRPRTGSFEELR